MALLFKTALACELANLDPARFNEAAANGFYTCAPDTTPGSARLFDLDQTAALFIFGHLMKMGLSGRDAGGMTCTLYETFSMHQSQEYDRVARFVGINGAAVTKMLRSGDPMPDKLSGPGEIIRSLIFDVKKIRDYLTKSAKGAQGVLITADPRKMD